MWRFSMERTKYLTVLLSLKEVSAKEAPEITQEEVIGLKGLLQTKFLKLSMKATQMCR